jgi:hypothetical protein
MDGPARGQRPTKARRRGWGPPLGRYLRAAQGRRGRPPVEYHVACQPVRRPARNLILVWRGPGRSPDRCDARPGRQGRPRGGERAPGRRSDATPPPLMRRGNGSPPPRPAAIDLVAAILVFGGLFGFSQLVVGDYVLTGSLPAKDPILGVALSPTAWPSSSARHPDVARLATGPEPPPRRSSTSRRLPAAVLALVLGHAGAAVILVLNRRWFSEMAVGGGPPSGPAADRPHGARAPAGPRG